MGHFHQGDAFEGETSNSLGHYVEHHPGMLWYTKLVDTEAFKKARCPKCDTWFENPFVSNKAIADFAVAIWGGIGGFIEAKSSKNKTSFPWKRNIAPHQMSYGLQLTSLGVPYVFLINNRVTPRDFRCYALTAPQLNHIIMLSSTVYGDETTLKWSLIEDCIYEGRVWPGDEIDRLPGSRWDMVPVVNLIRETHEEVAGRFMKARKVTEEYRCHVLRPECSI